MSETVDESKNPEASAGYQQKEGVLPTEITTVKPTSSVVEEVEESTRRTSPEQLQLEEIKPTAEGQEDQEEEMYTPNIQQQKQPTQGEEHFGSPQQQQQEPVTASVPLAPSIFHKTEPTPEVSQPAVVPRTISRPDTLGSNMAIVPKGGQYFPGESASLKNQRDNHQWAYGFGLLFLRAGEMESFNGAKIVPAQVTMTLFFHDAVLDFSRAHFVHPITNIYIFSWASGVRITIPRGVRLEPSGCAVCGDFEGMQSGVDANNPEPDAPIIRIDGISVCASNTFEINYQITPLEIVRAGPAATGGGMEFHVQNV